MAASRAMRWGMLASVAQAIRSSTRPGAPGFFARVAAMPRLLRATVRGEYTGTTFARLMMMAGAILYVVSPVDFMPEALFTVFGMADDAFVVTWLAMAVITETEQFLDWEHAGGPVPGQTVPGQTVPGGPQPASANSSYPQDTVR